MEVGEPLAGPDTSLDSEVIKENCSNVGFLSSTVNPLPSLLYKFSLIFQEKTLVNVMSATWI